MKYININTCKSQNNITYHIDAFAVGDGKKDSDSGGEFLTSLASTVSIIEFSIAKCQISSLRLGKIRH